ncbi:MAG: peptide deformylase [Candidatus Latescibacterota bacterium]
MQREVLKYGARVLRQVCAPVEQVDDEVRALIEDLFDSMHAADGVGLAAPQIGVARRVIVVDVTRQEPQHEPVALVNPRLASGTGSMVAEEGCLSFPDLYGDVERLATVEVEALDASGEAVCIRAEGFFARVLQHEIDHLDGKLFIDRLSPLKRQLLHGALKRLRKEGEAWDRERVLG